MTYSAEKTVNMVLVDNFQKDRDLNKKEEYHEHFMQQFHYIVLLQKKEEYIRKEV